MAKYIVMPRPISPNSGFYLPHIYPIPRDQFDFQFIYEMNPVNRMQWFAGISMYSLADKPLDYYFSIGFRTALRNNY